MSLDLFGPASAPGSITSRPGDSRAFGALDTFFKDCSSPTVDDGTELQASFFNQMLAIVRSLARGNGQTAGAVDIVTQDNTDDSIILKAVQHLIQRGQPVQGVDSGTADAMIVALSPALAEYKTGMVIWIKKGAAANLTTTPTANINGLGVKTIVRRDGSALALRDLPANAWLPYTYDLGADKLRVIVPVFSEFIPVGNPTLYVRTDGNDANDGSANDAAHAFATIQAAINYSAQIRGIGGRVLNIQLGNAGTYTGAVAVQNPVSNVVITGDIAAQGSYVIAAPVGALSQIVYAGGSALTLKGVTVTTSRTDINFVLASYAGSITLDHVTITAGATTPFYAMAGVACGAVTCSGPVTVNGNFGAAMAGISGGSVTLPVGTTVTINACTFSTATLYAQICGTVSILGTWAGTATGPRANAIINGAVYINGVNPPGSSAATTASGGQVV